MAIICVTFPSCYMENTARNIKKDSQISATKKLQSIDFNHIWHPFTQADQWFDADPLIVEKAEAMYLIDCEGNRYLDGISSLWCNVHGHSHPEFLAAGHRQLDELMHSTLLGLTHRPIIECTERLVELLPGGLSRVFYSDSGTSAVEAGLRISLEWWQKQSSSLAKIKTQLASLQGAYHGDTLGAVGIGYLDFFHGALSSNVVQSNRVRPPHIFRFEQGLSEEQALARSIAELEDFFVSRHETLAGFFVEPIVQGAAGIWIHPPEYLAAIARFCRKYSVHLIVDEVATGFGKSGKLFACELADLEPDILIMGKGLSGGYLPISAAACTEELFEGFRGKPSEGKTFFYGQTFAGNPLAARFAEVNLRIFQESSLLGDVASKIDYFGKLIEDKIENLSHVDEVRRAGLMTGIELTAAPGQRQPFEIDREIGVKITRAARKKGVVIRPLGNVIILMPALAMSNEELETLVSVTAAAIDEVCS